MSWGDQCWGGGVEAGTCRHSERGSRPGDVEQQPLFEPELVCCVISWRQVTGVCMNCDSSN